MGINNGNQFYSFDESLFFYLNNKQIYLIGAFEFEGRGFRLEATQIRNQANLETFISAKA